MKLRGLTCAVKISCFITILFHVWDPACFQVSLESLDSDFLESSCKGGLAAHLTASYTKAEVQRRAAGARVGLKLCEAVIGILPFWDQLNLWAV